MDVTTKTPSLFRRNWARFLLAVADRVYNTNARHLERTDRRLQRASDRAMSRYSMVAAWCWDVLIRHASTEEALAVGNRRLAPMGLALQRRDEPTPPANPYAAEFANAPTPRNSSDWN